MFDPTTSTSEKTRYVHVSMNISPVSHLVVHGFLGQAFSSNLESNGSNSHCSYSLYKAQH
jgi:hypothetical protein